MSISSSKVKTCSDNEHPVFCCRPRQRYDLGMLMNGGFSPLQGFQTKKEWESVVSDMCLPSGECWPIPVTLDVNKVEIDQWFPHLFPTDSQSHDWIGSEWNLALPDSVTHHERIPMLWLSEPGGRLLALMVVESIWKPDRRWESRHVYGSEDDDCHPEIAAMFSSSGGERGDWYIGGRIVEKRSFPSDCISSLNHSPLLIQWKRDHLWRSTSRDGASSLIAFQTRNPLHRSHVELMRRAMDQVGPESHLLIHPVVGQTKPGDIDPETRVLCYQALLDDPDAFPVEYRHRVHLATLPLAMRMAGPREALWHALIRRNYGATHFIVGRDHAGPGCNRHGQPFYEAYAAQELCREWESRLGGIQILCFPEMVYVPEKRRYESVDLCEKNGWEYANLSGTKLRLCLREGSEIPSWFSFSSVLQLLRPPTNQPAPVENIGASSFPLISHPLSPSNHNSGRSKVFLFTGLSGSGKSTLVSGLKSLLTRKRGLNVITLDGDECRRHLCPDLGFSREDRSRNLERLSWVVVKMLEGERSAKEEGRNMDNGQSVILCSFIAPYRQDRIAFRQRIERETQASFHLIHVSTPLSRCEQRDPKGLYEKCRLGLIPSMTGVTDPYEVPEDPDFTIDTSEQTCLQESLAMIESKFFA